MSENEFQIPEEIVKRLTPAEREAVASGKVDLEKLIQDPAKKKAKKSKIGPVAAALSEGKTVDGGDLLRELAHNNKTAETEEVDEDGNSMPPEEGDNPEVDLGLPETPPEPSKPVTETIAQTHCPRCNWNLGVKEVEPTGEDKKEFLRYVLGAPSFEKTYDIFGGAAKVTFRAKRPVEQDYILKQLALDKQKGRITDFAGNTFLRQRYQAAVMFKEMRLQSEESKKEENNIFNHELQKLLETPENVTQLKENLKDNPVGEWIEDDDTPVRCMHAALVAVLPPPIYSAMFQLSLDFEMLVDVLTWRARDKDFWSATAAQG